MAKSWDIQPNKKAPPAPVRAPQPVPVSRPSRSAPLVRRPVERMRPKPKGKPAEERVAVKPALRRERVLQGRDREPLKERRKRERRRVQSILIVCVFILIAALYGALWLPFLRISSVEAAGPDAAGIQQIAESQLSGTEAYIFPRNSIVLFSQDALRNTVLATYPEISSISIAARSFSSLQIVSMPRAQAFVWCGETYGVSSTPEPLLASTTTTTSTTTSAAVSTSTPQAAVAAVAPCYTADATGLLYAVAPASATTSTLTVYAALQQPGSAPVGEQIAQASQIPNTLAFVKALGAMNVLITTIVLRTDEADLYTPSGTRITYVLGHEQMAEGLAKSSFSTLNVNLGGLEYIDLRFDGKVYFRKKGGTDSSVSDASGQ